MSSADVLDLLDKLGDRAREELTESVDIDDVESFPDEDDIYSRKRKWLRMRDVVAVVADLKNSTQLNFNRYANTSASLYDAVMSNSVRAVNRFDADFVDVQGDGLFALYHGSRAYKRGMCAAITLLSFSHQQLVPALEDELGDGTPESGLKIGIDAGTLVVKEVGMRGTTEPVWAGRPVNWAFKCAQSADRDEVVVTQRIWEKFEDNDYVTHSCDCRGIRSSLWTGASTRRWWSSGWPGWCLAWTSGDVGLGRQSQGIRSAQQPAVRRTVMDDWHPRCRSCSASMEPSLSRRRPTTWQTTGPDDAAVESRDGGPDVCGAPGGWLWGRPRRGAGPAG